jgi:hypothetical protein
MGVAFSVANHWHLATELYKAQVIDFWSWRKLLRNRTFAQHADKEVIFS